MKKVDVEYANTSLIEKIKNLKKGYDVLKSESPSFDELDEDVDDFDY